MRKSKFITGYRFAQKCGLADAIYGKPLDHDSPNGRKLDKAIQEARESEAFAYK